MINGVKFEDMHLLQVLTPPHDEHRYRHEHPYSYDPEVKYATGKRPDTTAYSDRLYQWEPERYDRCATEAFGSPIQMFENRISSIEKFLRLYFDSPTLVLTQVVQMVNVSNGFPVWLFAFIKEVK